MVDRAFRATLRNFSTLFFLVAVVTVPLHLAYSVMFANVIETRELHDVIETFPDARQVRGVGKAQLDRSQLALGVVTILELIAIPFLARGTRRLLEMEASGDLPTVRAGLEGMRDGGPWNGGVTRAGPVVVAAITAVVLGLTIERIGLLLLEFVSDPRTFAFFGLMQGVSRAAALPFLLVTLVFTSRTPERENLPDLY